MVRVEWQYYQTKNIARSSHFIPGPYFRPCPQSVVRSPQSAVRPRFTVRSRSETLYPAALRTYNAARLQQKHTYQWKNIRLFRWKRLGYDTGRLWIAVGVTFPRETAQRRHATLLHYKTTADLFAVAPLPVLPPHPSQLYLVCFHFLFFSTTKIKKRFSFRILSSLILFPAVSLQMKSFVKFEFLISWNLWNRKLKIQF